MAHATALVDNDATTPFTCGCQRLVDAGWTVRCNACGRGAEAADELLVLVYRPTEHTCASCPGCFTDAIADAERDDDAGYDEQRDAALVDAAERRVA